MANFRTHITTSCSVGVLYAGAGFALGLPLTSCLIAGGLCGLAGMLPDLDSDSGVPVRETMSFAAAIAPILMIDRFQHMGLSTEETILAAATVYLLIRFGLASAFKRYTVHRGMWHSIPAALIASVIGYLLCTCHDEIAHIYKAGGVFVGFMSHLILDEFYSLQVRRGRLRIKRSFGTALKMWSPDPWANFSTYAKLILLVALAFGDTHYLRHYVDQYQDQIRTAREQLEQRIDAHRAHWVR